MTLNRQMEICKKNKKSPESLTYVPYYDSILEKKQRGMLIEIKVNT